MIMIHKKKINNYLTILVCCVVGFAQREWHHQHSVLRRRITFNRWLIGSYELVYNEIVPGPCWTPCSHAPYSSPARPITPMPHHHRNLQFQLARQWLPPVMDSRRLLTESAYSATLDSRFWRGKHMKPTCHRMALCRMWIPTISWLH